MDMRPTEFAVVSEPEVDPAALAVDIGRAAEHFRRQPASGPSTTTPPEPPARRAGPRRHPVSRSAELLPYAQLHGGRVTTALQRAIRRSLRWYLWPVTAVASRHNTAVADVLAEHEWQIARLRMETERVARDVDGGAARQSTRSR